MSIIDVVKWDAQADQLAYKFPSSELGTWTQLIVSETQEAWLLLEGKPIGPYQPGRHTLDIHNYPGITAIVKGFTGGQTPFTAEVFFINKAISLNVKWGTSTPMQIQDPKFKIMLPVRAHGQLGLQVADSAKFLFKIVGTLSSFNHEQFSSYFRGIIVTKAKDAIAKILSKENYSILDLAGHLEEISQGLKGALEDELEEFGLALVKFYVNSVDAPEDDPAVARLKQALAKKAEMEILGFNYQQERSFDALEAAAGNNGIGGAVLGAGLGLGMGSAMGAGMAQAASQMQFGRISCPTCRTSNAADAVFCSGCGSSITPSANKNLVNCPTCSKMSPPGAFCAHCGSAFQKKCTKCSTLIPHGAKFCPSCGNLSNS